MGYNSDVQAVIYGKPDDMDAYITTEGLIFNNIVFKDFNQSLRYYEAKIYDTKMKILHLYGDGWKWYGDYEDVEAWMKFMRDSVEHNLDFEFIRVGENTGDIETESSPNSAGLLYVRNPTIANDFDMDKEIALIFLRS